MTVRAGSLALVLAVVAVTGCRKVPVAQGLAGDSVVADSALDALDKSLALAPRNALP